MSASSLVRTLPRTLGPFQLISCLGQGGFAPVWRAEEVYDGRRLRDVAVKLFFLPEGYLSDSAEAVKWRDVVIDEASALCRVEHANIVRFHTLLRDDARGIVALVMEYIAGKNLGAILRKGGPMNATKVLEIGISIAWALAAVHNAGLVHRDVKPENIIESASGYKLVDFGIVVNAPHASQSGAQTPPLLVGTPGFIPPEYFDSRAFASLLSDSASPNGAAHQTEAFSGEPVLPSPAGDIYSLGVTLFSLATGSLPSEAPGAQVVDSADPVQRKLGQTLIEFTRLLLEADPNRRPRYADWVARELEAMRTSVLAAGSIPVGTEAELPTNPVAVTVVAEENAQIDTVDFMALRMGVARTTEIREPKIREPDPRPPLVGRRDALAVIERAAREVHQGNVRVVLVTGTLGVGRTRFLEESISYAGVSKDRTLRMHSSPERPGPLKPLLASLRALQDGHAFRLLEGAIERVLLPTVLPSTQKGEIPLEVVEDALLVAATDEPVVLAADDVQWSDENTLKLLQLLVERADRGAKAKLLVLVTARDEPRASAPLRAFLGTLKGRTRASTKHIALEPLTPSDATALAQGVCPLEDRVKQVLVRDSGGIPFFLVNALLAWHETEAIVWRGGTYHATDENVLDKGIPGVAALLDARLASYFPPDGPVWRSALRALAVVALFGGGLPTETLFAAFVDDDAIEDALETLVGAGIFVVAGELQEVGFAQEMVRQAALNLVRPKPWFRRLHRSLLDTVARRSNAEEEAAFLANGYEKLGEKNEARVWLARAMERSMRVGLFTDAMILGDRLAAIAPDRATRVDVELSIVRALVQGRQFDEAKARLERIKRIEVFLDESLRATALDVKWRILRLEVARGLSEAGEDPKIVADADALADPALACEARMALAGVIPAEQAMGLIGDAVTLAERCGPALEFAARVRRFEFIHSHGTQYAPDRSRDLQQAERDLRKALSIARSTASVWQEVHVEGDMAVLENEMGRTDAAIERLRPLVKQAEMLGMTEQRRTFLNNLAACLMREGRSAEAAEVAQQAVDLAMAAGDPTLHGVSLSLRAYALFCTGDFQGAFASVNEAEQLQREHDGWARGWTLIRRAVILEAMGRSDEALDDARAAQVNATRHEGTLLFLTAVLWEKLYEARRNAAMAEELRKAVAALAAVELGRRTITRRLVEQATAWLASTMPPMGP